MTLAKSNVKQKLLVVDDEPQIREILKDFLSDYFDVILGSNGNEAVTLAQECRPDVILMDVMMPGLDGISAVKKIRENEITRPIPVLMLTAANTTRQRIRAFDLGVDDYISKPFEVDEVIARIQSKLNRVRDFQKKPNQKIELANLVMDQRSQEVLVDGKLINLGPVEYGILELLLDHAGGVVSRKLIMDTVWKNEAKSDRLIDAHLTSLRKKISGFQAELQTVYGEGYRLKVKAGNLAQK
jgi:two-component system OmpR family response regulator